MLKMLPTSSWHSHIVAAAHSVHPFRITASVYVLYFITHIAVRGARPGLMRLILMKMFSLCTPRDFLSDLRVVCRSGYLNKTFTNLTATAAAAAAFVRQYCSARHHLAKNNKAEPHQNCQQRL